MARIRQASDRPLTAKFVSTGEGIAATGMLTCRLRDVMAFMFTSLKGLQYVGSAIVEMQDMVNLNLIQYIFMVGATFGSPRNVVSVNKRQFTWFLNIYRTSEYTLSLELLKINKSIGSFGV